MTEDEKAKWIEKALMGNVLSNNVEISDAFEFVLKGVTDKEGDHIKVVDTELPTLCFSFFNNKNAVYREGTGEEYLAELTENENTFVSLIGSYDFSSYTDCYAHNLYQQTGGKYFEFKDKDFDYDNTDLSDRLIRYIFDMGENQTIPEINTYPMILSTGLVYAKLDKPITVDYLIAYETINSSNREEFKGYADTDGDGLYDFEEINFDSDLIKWNNKQVLLPTFGDCISEMGEEYFYVKEGLERYSDQYVYTILWTTQVLPIISSPISKDTDGDGLCDGQKNEDGELLETAPLARGIADGIVGELTVVSAGGGMGHAFLVYRSYIDDFIDFTNFTGGYTKPAYRIADPQLYSIKSLEYITIGNAGWGIDFHFKNIPKIFENEKDNADGDVSGVYFNRELANEFWNYIEEYDYNYPREYEKVYQEMASLSMPITGEQLDTLIAFAEEKNYYHAVSYNCVAFAAEAWNAVMINSRYHLIPVIFPQTLKEQIEDYPDSKDFDIYKTILHLEI